MQVRNFKVLRWTGRANCCIISNKALKGGRPQTFRRFTIIMNKIESFKVNHLTLDRGIYLSRVDGDVDTFDLRFVKPNTPPYLPSPVMHTIEHLFATYARNSKYSDNVIYFGPMGCRTGFYFLTRGIDRATSVGLIKDIVKEIKDFEGEIPGNSAIECGNYKEHDLQGAKKALAEYYDVIRDLTEKDIFYKA